jgi:fibronectin type 3 domain-containing protein
LLSAEADGTRCVALQWQPPADGLQYRVFRSESPWCGYGLVAETEKCEHRDQVPEAGRKYYYFVQSVRGGHASQASPMAQAETFPALPRPATPQHLRVTLPGGNTAALRWDHAPAAAGYVVFAKTQGENVFVPVGHTFENYFLHTGLPLEQSTEYRVQAYHDSGASAFSSVCTCHARPPRGMPLQPMMQRRFPVFSMPAGHAPAAHLR